MDVEEVTIILEGVPAVVQVDQPAITTETVVNAPVSIVEVGHPKQISTEIGFPMPVTVVQISAAFAGGSADVRRYRHIQNEVAEAWVITHNLNTTPQIVVAVDGKNIEGVINYPSSNSAIVQFNAAVSGYAYCVG